MVTAALTPNAKNKSEDRCFGYFGGPGRPLRADEGLEILLCRDADRGHGFAAHRPSREGSLDWLVGVQGESKDRKQGIVPAACLQT